MPNALELLLSGDGHQRPWVARLEGVGWYAVQPRVIDETYDGSAERKYGWRMSWLGAETAPVAGMRNMYSGRIFLNGIYKVHVPSKKDEFIAVVDGNKYTLGNPLPVSFTNYMNDHDCDYTTVWKDAWLRLWERYVEVADDTFERWTDEEIADWKAA